MLRQLINRPLGYSRYFKLYSHLHKNQSFKYARQSFLSKETTRWQRLSVEPPTFKTEVQRANHYTTASPQQTLKDFLYFLDIFEYVVMSYHHVMCACRRSGDQMCFAESAELTLFWDQGFKYTSLQPCNKRDDCRMIKLIG